MPNRHTEGFDPQDQAQAAVEQASVLMVASPLAHHPPEPAAALPTGDAIPRAWGKPQAGALEHGDVSAPHRAAMEARDMAPYSATGRLPQHPRWPSSVAPPPAPPPAEARPQGPMADKLHPEMGGAIDRWRTWTVEPGLGLITAIGGFRPCSRRGWRAAAGECCLGGLAVTWKRLHPVPLGEGCLLRLGGTEPGVRSWAQRPNGQTRRIHQDALG